MRRQIGEKARDRAAPSSSGRLSLRDCDFPAEFRGAAEVATAPAILSIRGQQSFPRHPLRPFRLSDFSSRKSPGPAGALMSACYPPPRPAARDLAASGARDAAPWRGWRPGSQISELLRLWIDEDPRAVDRAAGGDGGADHDVAGGDVAARRSAKRRRDA